MDKLPEILNGRIMSTLDKLILIVVLIFSSAISLMMINIFIMFVESLI